MIGGCSNCATIALENETLRAQLAEQNFPSLIPQSVFRLTRSEAIVFGVLMRNRAPHREMFMQALYSASNDPPVGKILDIFICKIREKLRPHGIEIKTIQAEGFMMSEASKARARELMFPADAGAASDKSETKAFPA
jgi:two-component system cell cycle response regulator CtrA